jgi:hypothetical protein
MKKIIVVIGGTLCAITGACAGLLYLELPAEYPASMVENATPEDEVVLLKLVKDKLTTLENDYADRVVIFTKDGEPIYKRENGETDGGPYLGDINFERGDGWEDDKLWDDVEWHLFEAGGGWGTYWIARDAVFGRPFVPHQGINRTVTIDLRWDWPDEGSYIASQDLIILKSWRVGEGVYPVYSDTDRSILTRCMLHAFRHEWPATGVSYIGTVPFGNVLSPKSGIASVTRAF